MSDVSTHAEITIRVRLDELEQPIVMLDKITNYDFSTNKYKTEPRKFIVRNIIYEFRNFYGTNNETMHISELVGSYFLKGNKKIGGKEEIIYVSGLPKANRDVIVNQIPSHLHNYAQQELAKEVKTSIDFMLTKGIMINYA